MNIRKYILITLIGLATIVGVYQAYLFFGKGTLSVQASPSDTTTIINKKFYTPSQSKDIILPPGEHKITLAADGYESQTITVNMGWKSDKLIQPKLTPKPLQDIVETLIPGTEQGSFTIEQPEFFLENTWAAGYVVSGSEGGYISLIILHRKEGKWQIAYHDHKPVDRNQTTIPDPVYDYVKVYQGE